MRLEQEVEKFAEMDLQAFNPVVLHASARQANGTVDYIYLFSRNESGKVEQTCVTGLLPDDHTAKDLRDRLCKRSFTIVDRPYV